MNTAINTTNNTVLTKDMQFLEKSSQKMNYSLLAEGDFFKDYLRTGEFSGFDRKSLSCEGESGGVLLPQNARQILSSNITSMSAMRGVCAHMEIEGPSLELLVADNNSDVGWVGEQDERAQTKTPNFTKITIQAHEMYAKPRATQRLLDDAAIDIDAWLLEKVSYTMSRAENHAFTLGDGDKKPKGFLNEDKKAPGSKTPLALETFKTGTSGTLGQDGAQMLINVFYSLHEKYMENACWMMPRSALPLIKSLKMAGNYIWSPATSLGAKDLLFGRPIIMNDDMPAPDLSSATASIAFGDFAQGYTIVDRSNVETLRDPYSAKPFIEFYTTKRVGGGVVDFDAIKILILGE